MQSVRFSGVSSESETETDSGEEIGIFTKRCDDNKASSSKGVDVGVHSHNLSTNQSPGELADSSTAPNNVNQNINSVGCPAPNIFQDNLEQIVGMELTTALSIMPSFSGNFATLSSFIDDIDGINDLLDVALRPVFFTAIKAKLSEDVRQKIAGANFNDWNTLRPVLRQRIRPKYSEIDARNRLRECKQKPGKTISEFADRVRSHLYDLNLHDAENVRFKSMNEDEAKRTFAKGLLDNNLRSHAMWVMADDLEKLINYAHEHNPAMNEPGPSRAAQSDRDGNGRQNKQKRDDYAEDRGNQQNKRDITCFRCNKKKHYASECQSNVPNSDRDNRRDAGGRPNERGDYNRNGNRENNTSRGNINARNDRGGDGYARMADGQSDNSDNYQNQNQTYIPNQPSYQMPNAVQPNSANNGANARCCPDRANENVYGSIGLARGFVGGLPGSGSNSHSSLPNTPFESHGTYQSEN